MKIKVQLDKKNYIKTYKSENDETCDWDSYEMPATFDGLNHWCYYLKDGEILFDETVPLGVSVIEPLETDADTELYNAINSATTIAGLKAALLGKNGLAIVKGRLK